MEEGHTAIVPQLCSIYSGKHFNCDSNACTLSRVSQVFTICYALNAPDLFEKSSFNTREKIVSVILL